MPGKYPIVNSSKADAEVEPLNATKKPLDPGFTTLAFAKQYWYVLRRVKSVKKVKLNIFDEGLAWKVY